MSARAPDALTAWSALLDPSRRPGLEATEHFMSWVRFGITAFAAAVYLLPLDHLRTITVAGPWPALVAGAFLYSLPHIFIRPARPTRRTRLRILLSTIVDFIFISAAVFITGGEESRFTWLFSLAIIGNVLRYGDSGGALTVAGSMFAFSAIVLQQGLTPAEVAPVLIARFGSFWILYFMAAYLSRYASRMEGVARRGAQLMEAIGKIGVPVNLAGNISLALEAVCHQIKILFDVDHVFIWLVQDKTLVGAAATGPHRDAFLLLRRPVDDPDLLGARVVRERRPLFLNNALQNSGAVAAELARDLDIQAIVGIPLIHGQASVGAMMLADARRPQRFREEDLAPAMLLGNLAATALYHASMHDQLRQAYTRTLETLGEAIDARDAYTGGHSRRIARYADQIAQTLSCSEEVRGHIHTAAMLHDVGKIGIPDAILLRPERLSERDEEVMRSHSLIGARLLRTAGFPEEVVAMVRHLHEHFDGSGYPAGLKGEDIPLGSRILAVADAFEAITSDRVYRPARGTGEAMAEMFRSSGTQFDPSIVEAFITSGILSAAAAASAAEGALPDGNGERPREDGEALFSTVATHLLDGCRQFAGEHVTSAIVGQVAAQAHRRNWTLELVDGRVILQTAGRHSLEEARPQVIAWLLQGIEQRSGRRIALHLLSDTLAQMSPAARGLYGDVLLSPPWEETAPRAAAARHGT